MPDKEITPSAMLLFVLILHAKPVSLKRNKGLEKFYLKLNFIR